LKIESLVVSNDVHVGLNFSAGRFTVAIEASSDLVTWTNVGEVQSLADLGTWMAPVPLPDLGSFFRLRVGPNPAPPPAPLSGASQVTVARSAWRGSSVATIGAISVADGAVEVRIKTQAGRTYRVSLAGSDGQEKQALTVTASSDVTAVKFPDQALPNPCYVKAIAQ